MPNNLSSILIYSPDVGISVKLVEFNAMIYTHKYTILYVCVCVVNATFFFLSGVSVWGSSW